MPQYLARQGTRELPLIHREPAVNEYIPRPNRIVMRLIEGRFVAIRFGIEDDEVGVVAGLEIAALGQVQNIGGQSTRAAEGLFERNDFVRQRIEADLAGEAA